MGLVSDAPRSSTNALLVLKVVGVVLILALVFGVGVWYGRASSGGAKNLVTEVTSAPRAGVVVSSVGNRVCLALLKENGNADTIKSCVTKGKILNFGFPNYGSPAVKPQIGEIYSVHRYQDYGVSDGIILVPPHSKGENFEPKSE